MEYEKAKRELKSYRFFEIRTKAQLEEIYRLDAQSKKVTSTISGMPTANDPHRLEDVWTKYIDETNKLVEYLSKDTENKETIRKKLDVLKNINQEAETILEERYINNKRIWEISNTMYESIPTIKRKIRKAIILYANIEEKVT